jgi:glycosyltransferase involved in cell wall biosynthesis
MTRSCLFVIPDAQASISGGNLYNQGLLSALRQAGADVRVAQLDAAVGGADVVFVDSLYLDHLPRLKRMLGSPCWLLCHYLPSLVASAEPSAAERAALAAADGFLVTSDFMARTLAALETRPTVVVPPAIDVGTRSWQPSDHVRGVMVANLIPGKGVLPFLDALLPAHFELAVIGSLEVDANYAAACQARAAGHAVHFAGPLSHPAMLDRVAASDLFISASRMESFGMALGEARALGVPIVARAGGNVAAHVDESAGGRLVATDEALAAECARLAQDPRELARRRDAARRARPPARTWADAAREFIAAVR